MSAIRSEEGWFWEWRTFGALPDEVTARVERLERRGVSMTGVDEYFVSTRSQQNVKLRDGGAFLKLKPLLVTLSEGFELYEETLRLCFAPPFGRDVVRMATSLLGCAVEPAGPQDAAGLSRLLSVECDGVRRVVVSKSRSQFVAGTGWVEIVALAFPTARVASLGIQSTRLDEVRRLRATLDPRGVLPAMNYVQACRRWA